MEIAMECSNFISGLGITTTLPDVTLTNPSSQVLPRPLGHAASTAASPLHERSISQIHALATLKAEDLKREWTAYWQDSFSFIAEGLIDSDSKVQEELQTVFSHLEFEHIQAFFHRYFEKNIKGIDLVDYFKDQNLDLTAFEEWVSHLAKSFSPESISHALEKNERKSPSTNVVTQFFPNLTYIFLRSFSLLDKARPPSSLYEYGVLVTLYFHFFKIPSQVVKIINKFVNERIKAAIISTSVLGLAVGSLYTYLRWFQGPPENIEFCKRVIGQPSKKVPCREVEYNKALSCHSKEGRGLCQSMMFVGPPGVGKSVFLEGLAGQLDKKVFQFDNALLFGSTSYGNSAAEKMWGSFKQVEGWESEVVFFCDEFGDATKSKAEDIALCLKPILDNPNLQFVGVLTEQQWKDLVKLDPAFADRFRDIHFEEMTDEQTEIVLNDIISKKAPDLLITQAAVLKIISLTKQDEGFKQPRKAVKLLKSVINSITNLSIADATLPALEKAQLELKRMKGMRDRLDSPLLNIKSGEYQVFKDAWEKAVLEEKRCQELVLKQRNLATLVKRLLALQTKATQEMRVLAESYGQENSAKKEVGELMLRKYVFVDLLKKQREAAAARLHKEMYPFVDVSFVEHVFKSLQTKEKI